MIDSCPKCDSKALDHIEPKVGEHTYACRKCGTKVETVEVTKGYLRELVMAKVKHSTPATA